MKRYKEREIRDVDGDLFSTGTEADKEGKWVIYSEVVGCLEESAIALDMAQAVIRNGKLDKDVVLREIDKVLISMPLSMESTNNHT